MNFLNTAVDHAADLSKTKDIGSEVMGFVRSRMKEKEHRKLNTVWHTGMDLRERADSVNWYGFRFLPGRLVAGPDVGGSEFYAVDWFFEDGRKHSTFWEDEIKYEHLVFKGESARLPQLDLAVPV